MKRSILIIEDEKNISNLIKFLLINKGYSVNQEYNGFTGLINAKQSSPSLIILDVMMPKFNGFQVAKELKQNIITNKIPILMLSSAAHDKHKELGLSIGVDEFITKPFDKNHLLDKVNELIK
jgi:DNA-binding response OmpR family regulator